jgi:uracil-DNA glycosylase family 4
MHRKWESLQRRIADCEQCPRLVEHCRKVAVTRKKMYAHEEYWGRPVPTFGPADARLLVLGLAPAAHGANRTGRMFTGDSSGDWLYEALHRFGFATQPSSTSAADGLELVDCAITAAAHCAPPDNRPTRQELDTCRAWLHRELEILRPQVVIVLGRIAWETWWKLLGERGADLPTPRPGFAHGQWVELDGQVPVLQSYHPSRQNTNTGRLTRPAWHAVFREARRRLG